MRDDESQENNQAVGSNLPLNSVGFTTPHHFAYPRLNLKNGKILAPVEIVYETYGTLNAQKDNAVLVLHALSGSAHAAGYHSPKDRTAGWWDDLIGPKKAFDTERYFVVSPSTIGSCHGSTGPLSMNPETGCPFHAAFPVIAIEDMVNALIPLMDYLGIEQWLSVAGGSMGGMQVLQWAISYPERVKSIIPIATLSASNAQSIAFSYIGRKAIMGDPKWKNGEYPPEDPPDTGLALARMLGHITYLSEESMREKFDRRLMHTENVSYSLDGCEFEVESYLQYQGEKFVKRFDANAYLVISRALDYFNAAEGKTSLTAAFEKVRSPALILSFSSDWIYPPSESEVIHQALLANGISSEHHIIETNKGHDAFLIEIPQQTALISAFLTRCYAILHA